MGAGKKATVIGLSSVVLVAVVVAVAIGVNKNNSQSGSGGGGDSGISTSNKAVKAMCNGVDYKDACEESLSKTNSTDPKELIKVGFEVAVNDIKSAIANSTTLKEAAKDPRTSDAYGICKDLLETAVDDLHRSFDKVGAFDVSKLDDYVADLKTWLSGTVTYQDTCIDAFQNTSGDAGEKMKKLLKTSSELSSNALAMVNELGSMLSSLQIPELNRRLLSHEEGGDEHKRHLYESEDPGLGWNGNTQEQRQLFESEDPGLGWNGNPQDRHVVEDDPEQSTLPGWIDKAQRHLLQAAPKPNAVVAQDGSGQFKTINDAVKTAPQKSLQPFVILIKAGIYKEYIDIPRHVNNVVFIGDGATKTKITGNKNFIDGINTYRTSTVSVNGDGFVAKDIGFENSAGAEKHQAVALRVSGDRAVFYRCQMDGYQDTLYTHTYRQFYRDCTISGTIDFIFGNAAAVFQNCKMIVRKPMDNQACMVTAQGRKDHRSTGGLILQNCYITAEPAFMDTKPPIMSYLGRPWKEFSRTIIMQSFIDANIAPEGWSPWTGTFGQDTCFYAEYQNRGPGSNTARRVTWKGIKRITPQEAESFTPSKFIEGDTWIRAAGVPYDPGMMKV